MVQSNLVFLIFTDSCLRSQTVSDYHPLILKWVFSFQRSSEIIEWILGKNEVLQCIKPLIFFKFWKFLSSKKEKGNTKIHNRDNRPTSYFVLATLCFATMIWRSYYLWLFVILVDFSLFFKKKKRNCCQNIKWLTSLTSFLIFYRFRL